MDGSIFETISLLVDNLYGQSLNNQPNVFLKRAIIREEWQLENRDFEMISKLGEVIPSNI